MPAQTVIKLRRDTAANWTSVDPILAAGEAGFETDSNKLKIGDGTSSWSQLSYASGGGGVAIDDEPPTDTEATPLWWDSASGTLFIYYDGFWVEAVVGQVGPQGPQGEAGADGLPGVVQSDTEPSDTSVLWADTDDPAEPLVIPAGGAAGEILAKASGDDYDTEWIELESGGGVELISSGSFSDEFTLSSIPGNYIKLLLYLDDAGPWPDQDTIMLTTPSATGYLNSAGPFPAVSIGSTGGPWLNYGSVAISIENYSTNQNGIVNYNILGLDQNSNNFIYQGYSGILKTSPITSITVTTSYKIQGAPVPAPSGSYRLYGVK